MEGESVGHAEGKHICDMVERLRDDRGRFIKAEGGDMSKTAQDIARSIAVPPSDPTLGLKVDTQDPTLESKNI